MHTIVMTGATRGIGRVAAERILRDDPEAHLVLITRGPSGERLAAELSSGLAGGSAGDSAHGSLAGAGRVSHVAADLGSLAEVRSAAAEIAGKLDRGELPPLRGFVGNAGIQYTNARTEGADGYEATFTVNVLANHVLLRTLMDRFAAPARIVITTSDTHFGDFAHTMGLVPAPVWQAPEVLARTGAFPASDRTRGGRAAYSTSKLATIYLAHEYARRLPAGVDVVTFNPSLVPGTGLTRDADALGRFAMRRIFPLLNLTPLTNSASVAGQQLADVALGRVAAPTGSYVNRDRVEPSSDESYDPGRERELWEAADRLTAGLDAPVGCVGKHVHLDEPLS
ncbi:NAD(P)-dependent dehydrogenase (short-subunit alcohol dehydrogenase family) [Promicromonospora sp. AC04]|uniref:SDR family NAD(P)-dependent oxidoreductase n=1 Tax=Promicromonospora sp. AC04 TaxID=2135723 RepID=UPI000D366813|nr:SDR family NAD(P)-dependent oxidoreductase [Promicromonospora sp. AC04]PUB28910.1 NAD(P)-dependent dehydrogenase (short-subunit alcohol dehydrogenase family) [Promicromonospora sp. AC04]